MLLAGVLAACSQTSGSRGAAETRSDASSDAPDAAPHDADGSAPDARPASGDGGINAGGDAGQCSNAGYTTPLDAGSSACAHSPGATGPAEQATHLQIAPDAGFTVFRNWTYDVRGGRTLQGDLYVPDGPHSKPGGLILGIHGGGWEDCERRRDSAQGLSLLRRLSLATGAAFFAIDYRLSQEGGQYPENLKDVRCALQYVTSRIVATQALGVDASRVVVLGESAGAHLALMLGLSQDRADLDPGCRFAGAAAAPVNVLGVYAFSPPTDLPLLASGDGLAGPAAQHYTNGACSASAPVDPGSCGCVSDNRCVDASPVHHACRARASTDLVVVHAPRTPDGEYDLFIPFAQAERLRDAFLGSPRFQLWVPDAQALLTRGCFGSDYIVAHGVVLPDGSLIPFAHGFMECLTDSVFPLLELAVASKVGGR